MSQLRPLRPHQVRAIEGLRSSLASGCAAPLLQLPTGAGKTVIAAHVVDGLRSRLKRVAFCVPSIGLVDQTFDRFRENGIDPADMGVLQGNHPWRRPHAPIQIATAQTLSRRSLPDVDAVVIDEAHLRFEVYDSWIKSTLGGQISPLAGKSEVAATHVANDMRLASRRLPRPFFVGLSATPWSKGLGLLFDDLIKPTSMQELIDGGFLSKFKVYAPSHPDLTGVRTVAGDYHEGDLAERMNQGELVADVVSTWLRLGNNQPTLCFATGRAHAKALHDRFTGAGVSAAYVDANTPREEREHIGQQLAAGVIKVVCNIGTLTTGIDWDVRCLILARPTKSHSLFVQIIGRALRTAPGKDYATILDHSDTHLRLGMVTDIDFDVLDDGKPKKKAAKEAKEKKLPLPTECLSCGGLIPVGIAACPCCGVAPPKPAFQEADGELDELRSDGSRTKGPSSKDRLRTLGKQEVWAQIRWLQEARNRSAGWAAHTYREIFDVWPRGMEDVQPKEPDIYVRAWVRAKDIRYAKSVAKREVAHA